MAQQTVSVSFTINVASLLTVTTQSLPGATVGQAYNTTVQATGGVAPYTWSATGLPAGLAMSSAGVISGTPSAAGTFNVVVTVRDSGV